LDRLEILMKNRHSTTTIVLAAATLAVISGRSAWGQQPTLVFTAIPDQDETRLVLSIYSIERVRRLALENSEGISR
jgi:hypothetical protein